MQKEIERKKHPSQVAQYIDSFLLFPLQCISLCIWYIVVQKKSCGFYLKVLTVAIFFYYWFPGMSIHIFPFIDPSGVKDILSSAYLRLHLMRWGWDNNWKLNGTMSENESHARLYAHMLLQLSVFSFVLVNQIYITLWCTRLLNFIENKLIMLVHFMIFLSFFYTLTKINDTILERYWSVSNFKCTAKLIGWFSK